MTKKLLAHGEIVIWKFAEMTFTVKDSARRVFGGGEKIVIKSEKFHRHINKHFGPDLTNLKIDIIMYK